MISLHTSTNLFQLTTFGITGFLSRQLFFIWNIQKEVNGNLYQMHSTLFIIIRSKNTPLKKEWGQGTRYFCIATFEYCETVKVTHLKIPTSKVDIISVAYIYINVCWNKLIYTYHEGTRSINISRTTTV